MSPATCLEYRPPAPPAPRAAGPAPAFAQVTDQPAVRAWWRACREAGRPFVAVVVNGGRAGVLYDALTLPPAADPLIGLNSLRLAVGALHIFRAHAGRSSRAVLSACAGRIWRLDPAEAREAAADLAELLIHAAGGAA